MVKITQRDRDLSIPKIDSKTGLLDHSYFMGRFKQELDYAQIHNTDLGLLVINLDNFQLLPSRLGPDGADRVLHRAAELIQEQVRTNDLVSRFAGEEFSLVFRNSNRVKTWDIAERIRNRFSENPIQIQSTTIYLSFSIGATTYRSSQAKGIDDLLLMAYEALYKAQGFGRNRIVMYGESLLFRALDRFQ